MPQEPVFKKKGIEYYQKRETIELSDTYCRMRGEVEGMKEIPEEKKRELEAVEHAIMAKHFIERAKYWNNLIGLWKKYYKKFFLAYEKGSEVNPLFPSPPFP